MTRSWNWIKSQEELFSCEWSWICCEVCVSRTHFGSVSPQKTVRSVLKHCFVHESLYFYICILNGNNSAVCPSPANVAGWNLLHVCQRRCWCAAVETWVVVTWFVLAECRLLDRKLKGNTLDWWCVSSRRRRQFWGKPWLSSRRGFLVWKSGKQWGHQWLYQWGHQWRNLCRNQSGNQWGSAVFAGGRQWTGSHHWVVWWFVWLV